MLRKMTCTVEAKKWGNSIGVVIPAEVVDEMGIRPGTQLDIDVREHKRVSGFGMWKDIAHLPPYERDPADDRTDRMFAYFDKKYGKDKKWRI